MRASTASGGRTSSAGTWSVSAQPVRLPLRLGLGVPISLGCLFLSGDGGAGLSKNCYSLFHGSYPSLGAETLTQGGVGASSMLGQLAALVITTNTLSGGKNVTSFLRRGIVDTPLRF